MVAQRAKGGERGWPRAAAGRRAAPPGAEGSADAAASGDESAGELGLLLEADGARAAEAPAPEGGEGSGKPARWRALLAGASPREVLARLMNGDPLGLRRHVGERLRARAYLLDADRALLRSMARCARFAVRYRGQPELARWLEERVDEALLDLVSEEAEALRRGEPAAPEALALHHDLARPLGLDPRETRAACAAFNLCPEPERRAFFALVIESRSLDELARAGEGSATEIARRARRALEAVLFAAGGPK